MQKKRSYNASFFSMEKGWQRPRQVATLLYSKMFLSGLAPNAKHKTGLYHTKIILFSFSCVRIPSLSSPPFIRQKSITKNRYPVQSVKD